MGLCIDLGNKEDHNSQATPSEQEKYKDMLEIVAKVEVNETSSIIKAPIHSIPDAKTMAYVGLKGSNREIVSIKGDGTKPIHCTEAIMQTQCMQVDETDAVYFPLDDTRYKPSKNSMVYPKMHVFETNNA